MSLRNFPPSDMASTSSVDERTPLTWSNSVQLHRQQTASPPRQEQSSFCPLVCVIFAVVLERITYYGILANLVLFCMNDLNFNASHTITITFVFTGLAWLMSTVGGFVGDSYSGRYNAVWASLVIYIYGALLLLSAAFIVESGYLESMKKGHSARVIALIGLLVVSIGEGAYKANLTAFGADQLQGQDDSRYRRFFNWYYWSINIGCFAAYTAIAYIEQVWGFTRGFAIVLGCIVLAAVFFCSCRSRYNCCPPSGNILKKMFNIMREARRKDKDDISSSQHCPGLEEYMPKTSWLDCAMMKYGGSYLDSDVEEVKTVGRIVVIFVVLIPYWAIYSQVNTTFLLQGLHMEVSLNPKSTNNDYYNIPPAWLSLVDIIFVLALIPVMDKCVYPWLDRKGWHLSVFTRISIGFLFAVASMIAAGIVELERRSPNSSCVNQTIGEKNYTACLLIAYQVPQYGLIGISEVFASVGALEFAYKEAPKSMQSFIMGLFFFVQSAGSLLGGAVFELCSLLHWTPNISKNPYVSTLDGRLYNYFFLLAGIQFVTWLAFLAISFNSRLNKRKQKMTFVARRRSWEST